MRPTGAAQHFHHRGTDLRTVEIDPNAESQVLRVLFVQTGIGTVAAGLKTPLAGIDAFGQGGQIFGGRRRITVDRGLSSACHVMPFLSRPPRQASVTQCGKVGINEQAACFAICIPCRLHSLPGNQSGDFRQWTGTENALKHGQREEETDRIVSRVALSQGLCPARRQVSFPQNAHAAPAQTRATGFQRAALSPQTATPSLIGCTVSSVETQPAET